MTACKSYELLQVVKASPDADVGRGSYSQMDRRPLLARSKLPTSGISLPLMLQTSVEATTPESTLLCPCSRIVWATLPMSNPSSWHRTARIRHEICRATDPYHRTTEKQSRAVRSNAVSHSCQWPELQVDRSVLRFDGCQICRIRERSTYIRLIRVVRQ